jgi:hypothetical protein
MTSKPADRRVGDAHGALGDGASRDGARRTLAPNAVLRALGASRWDAPPALPKEQARTLVHDLTLVTRNTRDVARTGVRLLDPFHHPAAEG